MESAAETNGRTIAAYIAGAAGRALPGPVREAARLCLADWLGVALGGVGEPAARIVREVALGWGGGRASLLAGGRAAAPAAALANGTAAHCLDFDDTYVKGVTHISAPVWAATLALGEETGADEDLMLKAFVAGFETASRVGFGLGEAVTARGWHGTGIFGRLGAAAAAAVLLGLDGERTLHALGAAATQAGGLTASFGTMAKPFHAGKAAMDGIIAAELAGAGLVAATSLLEPGGGLDAALIQDGSRRITPAEFTQWAILDNSFKPYAACHLTHPAVDAARALLPQIGAIDRLQAIHAAVGALALTVTGEKSGTPATPLAGKFDLKYCVALALHGHTLSAADFRTPWRPDPAVCATARRVSVSADPEFSFASARLALEFSDGAHAAIAIPVAKGHPSNPMSWDDMQAKFAGLTEPAFGRDSSALLARVREFGESRGALDAMRAILGAGAGAGEAGA